MSKRLCSMILAIAMVFSLFSGLTISARAVEAPIVGEYVIAANVNGTYYAMNGFTLTSGKISSKVITVTNGKVSQADAQGCTITLDIDNTSYTISNGTQYLAYKGSSGTNFEWVNEVTDSALWTFSDGTYGTYRATNGRYPNRSIIYRAGSYTVFGAYAFSNVNGTEYFDVELLEIDSGSSCSHVWDDGVVTTAPTCYSEGVMTYTCTLCEETKTEVIPMTGHADEDGDYECDYCENPVYQLDFALSNGELVTVYNPAADRAMSGAASGTKLAPAAVNCQDGLLGKTLNGTAPLELTVVYADDTYFYLKSGDKFLTTGATGNSLALTDTADYGLWYLGDQTDSSLMVYSKDAIYNGNPVALEYYNGNFTTYGYSGTNPDQYAMQLYTAPGSGDPQPPEPEPTLVDVYVVDQVYGSQTEIKLWAWGADGNNAPSWDERPAMEYLGSDAVADKEAEQGGPFNDLPYYKYTLNVDAYGDGLLFTSPNGQSNNCAMTEEQKEAGLVVFYLYNNGYGASAGDAEIWKLDSHTVANCSNPETYHYVGILNNGTYDRTVGEALGHAWGAPSYTWAANHSTCTAEVVCTRNEQHKITETAEAVAEPGEDGVTYTAEFPTDRYPFETQTEFVAYPDFGDMYFEKVTDDEALTDGDYLIVYEAGSLAFNGGLATLDATGNSIAVDLDTTLNKIQANEDSVAAVFTIEAMDGGYSVKSASGYYISARSDKNSLESSENPVANAISFDNGSAVITSNSRTLQYYNSGSSSRFRYYGSNQKPVALYKLVTPTVHEHNVVYVEPVAPTCTENGTLGYYYCDAPDCPLEGLIFADEELTEELTEDELVDPAPGHDWGEWTVVTEPTCTEDGHEIRECSVCHETETHTTLAEGHLWGDWWVEEEATCAREGTEMRRCDICNAEETRSIPKTEHTPGEPVAMGVVPPTCTENGNQEVYVFCSFCGEQLSCEEQILPATGHNPGTPVQTNYVAPQPGEEGGYDLVTICSNCNEELERVHVKLLVDGYYLISPDPNWDFASIDAKDLFERNDEHDDFEEYMLYTTLEQGQEIKVVKVENNAITGWYPGGVGDQYIVNANHAGDVVIYFRPAENNDWTEFGKYFWIGYYHIHDPEQILYTAPSCTEEGNEAYWHCKDQTCELYDKCFTDDTLTEEFDPTIAATGHTWGEWEVDPEPTCLTPGQRTRECAVCHEHQTETLTALGHDFSIYVTTVDPTCVEQGYDLYKCSRCSETEKSNYTETVDHTWGDWVVTNQPTCTEEGEKTRECSVCHTTETETVAALGHTPGEPVDVEGLEPTCTATGYYYRVTCCTVCEQEISRETVELPMADHTPGEPVDVEGQAPTCTAVGYYYRVTCCTVCEQEISRETVELPMVDHTPGEPAQENYNAPTYETEGGYDTVVRCTVCGAVITSVHTTLPVIEPTLPNGYYLIKPNWNIDAIDPNDFFEEDPEAEGQYILYTALNQGDKVKVVRVHNDQIADWYPTGYDNEYQVPDNLATDVIIHFDPNKNADWVTLEGYVLIEEASPAHVHTVQYEDEVPATCLENGVKGYYYCDDEDCELYGHFFEDEELTIEIVDLTIPALGHNYEAEVTAPTCTEQGYTTYTCLNCGDSYVDDYTEAKGHVPGEPAIENYVDASADEEGGYDTVVRCKRCGDIVSTEHTVLPALGEDGLRWDDDGEIRYYEGGVPVYKGLVRYNDNYYYINSELKAVKDCTYVITKTNGLLPSDKYVFNADGTMVVPEPEPMPEYKEGFVFDDDGEIRYYVDGEPTYAGLVLYEGDYYYINSSMKAVKDCTYTVTKTNDLMAPGAYEFDADGKMILPEVEPNAKNGLVFDDDGEIRFYENGVPVYAGLVQSDEGDYYYINSAKTAVKDCSYVVTKTNNLMEQGTYRFDADGKMVLPGAESDGLRLDDDGELRYYVAGIPTYAGLVEVDGDYYYINSTLTAVRNCTYVVTKTNGLKEAGTYEFDADGKMIVPEIDTTKNGLIWDDDGELRYYEDGVAVYKGLVCHEGYYYYINSTKKAVRDQVYGIKEPRTNGLPVENGYYYFDEYGRMDPDSWEPLQEDN